MSDIDELIKLKELLDKNVITQEEFDKKKSELLNQKDNKNNPKTKGKKEKKKTKPSTIILAIIIVAIIVAFANTTSKVPSSYTNKDLLISEYNLSEEEANQVISVIDNCGYSDYYSDYTLEKSIDNEEIPGSIGFEIKNGENIVGFIDIKDNKVVNIQYSDKILYENDAVQHTLSEYVITSDEESSYISQTQEVIKSVLKSPSTAKFPWSYDEYGIGKKDGSVIVQGYVDSQNGFGAMVRGTYQVTYTNNTVTSLIFDGEEYMK